MTRDELKRLELPNASEAFPPSVDFPRLEGTERIAEVRQILLIDEAGLWPVTERTPTGDWRFVETSTVEGAEALLVQDATIRVAVWTYSGNASQEHLEALSALRTRHRLVQWLALLPQHALHDNNLAVHIAQHCFDYLTVPVEGERLYRAAGHACGMSHILELALQQDEASDESGQMVGTSAPMRELHRALRKVAASDVPVFISGESGTGKELAARAIHQRSARAAGPFIAVDCAAIPRSLVHSELFGHERGAFTGAGERRAGRIEVAEGGTLFLDEIGDLPLELQVNLLRFLQESTIQRVGSTRVITVNVRVVAATHVDLEAAVKEGRFREDLYYRLNVLRVHVPPLRERAGDIELLANYFLKQFSKDSSKVVRGFTTHALSAMHRYSWPGNIRELINRVRRASVMCEGAWVAPRDLDLHEQAKPSGKAVQLGDALEAAERQAVRQAITLCSNNYSAAARMLGVSRMTLYRLLEKHRPPPDPR